MASLHEEDAVKKVQVLLELTVSLNLIQEERTADPLTLQQFANDSRFHEVMDRTDSMELNQRRTLVSFLSAMVIQWILE